MNHLGLCVALVSSLVAGCIANDQTDPGTTTSSQDLAIAPAATTCIPDRINTCIFPSLWNTSITSVDQYWAGDGTSAPAKVMVSFLYPTKADPVTGLASAFYVFEVAGYETCTTTTSTTVTCTSSNALAKVFEVPANLLPYYRAAERVARDTHEAANPLLSIWDGGVGGPLLGRPGGPVGPGGIPLTLLNTVRNSAAAVRSAYVNVYDAAAAGGRTVGIAAP